MDPSEEILTLLRSVQESMERISPTLTQLNAEPNAALPPVAPAAPTVVQGVTDQAVGSPMPSRRLLSARDIVDMRRELRTLSTGELHMLFAEQANKSGTGIPLGVWLNSRGTPAAAGFGGIMDQLDPSIAKALDSASASALIRQDLEPILYELYIREFPAFDRIPKEPANGLVHTFQQITSFGDAQFMGELGTVTDDQSTYVRQTTNVSILATRRGVSLKSQFGALQSGSGFNPEQLELQGGLRAIAQKMQRTIFGGNGTNSGGTANNELGLYDVNGFTGLRAILNTANAVNVDPATNPDTTGSVPRAIRAAASVVSQNGGRVSMSYLNPLDVDTISNQLDARVRYNDPGLEVSAGQTVQTVTTVFGRTGMFPVPGNSIDQYVSAAYSGNTVRDIYLLDESTVSLPYLGSEGPTVLDIPIGISGQLTHLYIIFGMWGLAVKAPLFNNKVRLKVA